ncbi:hypothetical protein LTR72_001833 [Exophiala xenobiotica]|nr:hypothetical protein LTR92_011199 [Exophiala xenobiotica]KAK5227950.1 hypothetical protein LTR72_001833 [Exophiala xenobiotica]KAK5285578.1 hypothetical protein LTR14_010852 [Exophiala xenobiotica]KAK5433659.1 hypothetical protein LTR18_010609 [Exophiala xenobiotica]KAK5480750.1 hypothetical protein LTR55_007253 [Exophiala xenobiotica]
MSITAPTRQALRHLRHLCSLEPVATRTQPRARSQSTRSIQHVPTFQQHRTISTTPSKRQEARPSSPATAGANTNETTASLPDITNYYTLFPKTLPQGPPPSGTFSVPLGPLKREFLQLQSQHHPDKYTSQPTAHQKSLALSSLLNSAYKTISDPLLRARYLLHHNYGIDITSEDNSTHSGLTDQETLMEVMEAQEAIEDAETQEQVDALKVENQARIDEAVKLLGQAFEQEDVEAAKKECIRLNYWRSLQQGLHDWEPGKEVRLIH